MKKLPTKTLENAIKVYETTLKVTGDDGEYCYGALDKATIEFLKELKEYRDAEEQGKLLMAPCKIGDTVWAITSLSNLGFDGNDECEIFECTVDAIAFYKSGRSQVRLYFVTEYFNEHVRFDDFGKTVFLTKEEAEVVLEKMKGE